MHMTEQGLYFVIVKKYNPQANFDSVLDGKVNILKCEFEMETIHPKSCTDIT